MKKQDPNAAPPNTEEWTPDDAFRYLTRVMGFQADRAVYVLAEAASGGRLPVTCRRLDGKRLVKEAVVRPDLWRDLLKFAFVGGRVQVKPIRIALEPGDYQYTVPARTVRALWPISPKAERVLPKSCAPSSVSRSKPGSAAA
jgi:hypothetical protein